MYLSKQVKKIGMVAGMGVVAAMSSTAIHAATIGFTSDVVINNYDAAAPATVFTMDLVADGLVYDTNGGSLTLDYDNTVLSITNTTIASVWNFFTNDSVNNAAGQYSLNVGNSGGVLTGTQALVTVEFTVIGAGSSVLALSEVTYGPWGYTPPSTGTVLVAGQAPSGTYCVTPGQYNCTGTDPNAIIALTNGNVTVNAVSAVPVPAAAWLFGSGLIGLVAVSRRKAV